MKSTPAELEYARRYRSGEMTPTRKHIAGANDNINVTPATQSYRKAAIEALREEYSLPTPRPVRVEVVGGYTGTLKPGGF